MATKGNIYAANREAVFDRFSQLISGNHAGLVLVVFTQPLLPECQDALRKSFAALDYGRDACTYANIKDLDPQEVFALVEGIDPLNLIAADTDAALLCSQAVRQDFPLMKPLRLFGRQARAFASINDLLGTEQDRQMLWHLIKSLN